MKEFKDYKENVAGKKKQPSELWYFQVNRPIKKLELIIRATVTNPIIHTLIEKSLLFLKKTEES